MFDVNTLIHNYDPNQYYLLSILLRVKGQNDGVYKFGCIIPPEDASHLSFGVTSWSNKKFADGSAYLKGVTTFQAITKKLAEKMKDGKYDLIVDQSHQIVGPNIHALLSCATPIFQWMLSDLQVAESSDAANRITTMSTSDKNASRYPSERSENMNSAVQSHVHSRLNNIGRTERKIADWITPAVYSNSDVKIIPIGVVARAVSQGASAPPMKAPKKIAMEDMAEGWGEWA